MLSKQVVPLLGAGIVLAVLSSGLSTAWAESRAQIAYWRTHYPELKPEEDPRAAKAHAFFKRLVQVAGQRPGTLPRLYIIADKAWDIALPIAIRDGWIILSRQVLERCYQDPTWGDDRLAFVLAHELAHQLQDDLWHIRFFDALEAAKAQRPVSPAFLEDVRRSASAAEHVLARELQADEQGILYAAMAGFNTQAIVASDRDVNFFADWVRALDPRRIQGIAAKRLRPAPEERAEALRAALRRTGHQAAAFQAGLWFYYAGNYLQAIRAFDRFRSDFPSREVHHNLAVSHHQLALQVYHQWQPKDQTFPFELSLAVEPLTLASQIYLERTRGQGDDLPTAFQEHLDEAIQWYREALAQDATFTPAALNLGAALVLRGVHAPKTDINPDIAEAVSILSRAQEYAAKSPELLNNLGVALFYDERSSRAQAALAQARTLAPSYGPPIYNLGIIARLEQRRADAQRYEQAYAQLEPQAASGAPEADSVEETVAGVMPGAAVTELPASWGQPIQRTIQLEGTAFTVATYPSGITTLDQDGEVLMLMVQEGFKQVSARGIMLGSQAEQLLARYGPPSRRQDLPQGNSWAYDTQRIAFQLQAGQVISWLRF
jgi:tetratricopeptide (TPR) repeat protein